MSKSLSISARWRGVRTFGTVEQEDGGTSDVFVALNQNSCTIQHYAYSYTIAIAANQHK